MANSQGSRKPNLLQPVQNRPLFLVLISFLVAAVVAALYVKGNLRPVTPSKQTLPNTQSLGASSASPNGWATYIDQENSFSIQYPPLGILIVTHPYPRGDHFSWENDGEFDFGVAVIDKNGLTFNKWLAENTSQSLDQETTTVNGMNGVLVFIRNQGVLNAVDAYLASPNPNFPFVYDIQFQCYTNGQCMPSFWPQILNSFRMLSLH